MDRGSISNNSQYFPPSSKLEGVCHSRPVKDEALPGNDEKSKIKEDSPALSGRGEEGEGDERGGDV